MRDDLPDYWPILERYHRVRERLFRTIIADCGLPTDGLILDAGCGDGFYSALMAEILGLQARIIGVDRNWRVLRAPPAANQVIAFCLSDVEHAGLKPNTFDAIWLCRSLHSTRNPQRRLSALGSLLKPGGRLIVIENDLACSPRLSWPADFAQRLQQALYQFLRNQCRDGAVIERYFAPRFLPGWLAQARLHAVTTRIYPVRDVVPLTADIEDYWQHFMQYRGQCLRPYLTTTDFEAYTRAFDPASPDYVLKRSGFECLEPLVVVQGYAP